MSKSFSVVKKGYDAQEVETYIAELEEVIKSYREKDIAIKNALVNAQIAADNIVKNAEIEADTYKLKAIEKLITIKNSVLHQKNHIENFKNDYNRLIQKYLKDYNDFDIVSVENKIDELDDYINDVIADKNLEDYQDTKVVKSIKKEYNDQLDKNNLLSKREVPKIQNQQVEQGVQEDLEQSSNRKNNRNRSGKRNKNNNDNNEHKPNEKNIKYKNMFEEETPIEDINLLDSKHKKNNINKSLEPYHHKPENNNI